MPQVLIIGYGNPLRGDDGLGWHAAQILAERVQSEEVEVLTCPQLSLDLLDVISQAERVIFVDARWDETPGVLSWSDVTPGETPINALSHHLDPYSLLMSVRELYGRCPEGKVISVTSNFFGYGEELSAPVSAVLPKLLELVQSLLAH